MSFNHADYYKDSTFQDKVRYYMVKGAVAIMAEANTVEHHEKRVIYCGKILNGTASIDAFCLGVTTNPAIKAHIDAYTDYDGDLEYTVNSLFDAFAGGAN